MLAEIFKSPATYRSLFYALAPIIGMIPGVEVDRAAHMIHINIDVALAGITAGLAAGGGVYAKFGKK